MDGGRHVENLEQGGHTSDINCHGILRFAGHSSRLLQSDSISS
jgi:hypothetical protein